MEEIKNFWNENPCGSNFIDGEVNRDFFLEYDDFRYRTEGHILQEFNKIDFEGKKVLEIGLGQGADSMQIANRGAEYHGIDLTEESVKRVTERFRIFDVNYNKVINCDATSIPYDDNSFDIIYSHGVIHHSPEIQTILGEIHRVLKKEGKAVIMLYHKNSINYYLSISLIRRIGLLVLYVLPFLSRFVSKVTGEQVERINKHITNLKGDGLSYLKMKNFIHKSTDGPDNVHASVWNKNSIRKLFHQFSKTDTTVHFLNERHLLGMQYLLTKNMKLKLAAKYGWHIWIKASK